MNRALINASLLSAAALAFAVLAASPARAQSTAFTYQGQLDDAGTPANGLHDFRFVLFNAATGGVAVASSVCVDDVDVVDGVFTVQLDFGQQFATMEQRYLDIEVRRDTGLTCASVAGFVLMVPRQQLTATPMAIHANSAFALDAADGSPASAVFVDNSGNVGVGTTAPEAKLHTKGVDEGLRIDGPSTGASNVSYVSFRDSNGSRTGYVGDGSGSDSSLYLDSDAGDIHLYTAVGAVLTAKSDGKVGIGTSVPAAKLDVRGDVKLGASGEYFAVKSPASDRSLRGSISFNGTIDATRSSPGFTITHNSTGVYTINFTVPFTSPPTVVVSGTAQCCRPRVTTTQTNSAFVHVLEYSTDALTDAPFTFIAMGP